ncbi:MAG: DUF4440 domain-containing protein [Hyphomonadaceae bacterium]|nr:DUF4440 domain-containing protein [Hyphomonadaceae bacterium]
MKITTLAAAALMLTLACAPAASAQNLTMGAPAWASPLVASDTMPTTGGRAAIAAGGVAFAARVTIAPAQGGVARVIRFETQTDGAILALRRFTGDASTGWWPWGPDTPYVSNPTQAQRTELESMIRAAIGASAAAQPGGPVATGARCSGERAFVEVAVGARAASFTLPCVSNADAPGRLAARLSALAGSRDHEELAAAAAQEVLATDSAFAALAAAEGVPAAFARYAAPDAIMLRGEGENTMGHEAIVARFANWPEGAALEWTPRYARVSTRGDMAWSWGDSVFVAADGTRDPGRYVSIWTRDVDGNWRFALDVGAE